MRREFNTVDGSYEGNLSTYKVEFFHVATGDKEVADEWEVEDWRYPDLTVIDYMDTSDWELSRAEEVSGIIVTMFVDGKAVGSVLWRRSVLDNFNIVYEVIF